MKKGRIFLLLLLITAINSFSQTSSFPQSFTGNWKGTLTWSRPGKPSQTFTMRLNILPADSGRYTWQIIYGDDPSTSLRVDNRQYLLIPVDTATGHWIIDERNSILLDSYWMGNTFIGAFTVGGNTISNQYWIDEEGLHVEFISYAVKPVATTGGTSKDIPAVDSYKILSLQKGILQKQ
jgi:hypothetical protein